MCDAFNYVCATHNTHNNKAIEAHKLTLSARLKVRGTKMYNLSYTKKYFSLFFFKRNVI